MLLHPKRAGSPTRRGRKDGHRPPQSAAGSYEGHVFPLPRGGEENGKPTGNATPTANSRLDGAALNRPESPASSRLLCNHGQSVVPAAQEYPSQPIRSRADQRTHAPIGQSDRAHPSSAGVSAARQSKLRTVRFRASAKAHSLRCSSSPNHKRFAGLRFGQRTTKGHPPHAAFVLTMFKIQSETGTGARREKARDSAVPSL